MKISTKGRYSLRLMLDLAQHYEDGPLSLKDISERIEKYSVSRRILICEDLNRYLDTIEKFSLLE